MDLMDKAASGVGIKLCMLVDTISRNAGGLYNSVRNSSIHLKYSGVDVSVLSCYDDFSKYDLDSWSPVTPILFNSRGPRAFGFSPSMIRHLYSFNCDVLHLHGIWQFHSFASLRWKKRSGKPMIISPRGMLDSWAVATSPWKKAMVSMLFEDSNLNHADCLHALNESEAQSFREYGLKNPIAIIPNGASLPSFIRKPVIDARPKFLLFLGRFHPKKGLSELINAWFILKTEYPSATADWHLNLAGWGDEEYVKALKHQVYSLNLNDSVHFLGSVYGIEKEKVLEAASAFILPSYSEGLPMGVLEAWAYGLPVFMTDECNLPVGFSSGAAVRISVDPRCMASVLSEELNRINFSLVAESTRNLVSQYFSWNAITQMHLEMYAWTMGRVSRPSFVYQM
jgi:glycosyltransferase involved in cell wall biosynthesis